MKRAGVQLLEELGRRCAELQVILDAIPALVLYKDANNRLLRMNRAAMDVFGTAALHPGFTHVRRRAAPDWAAQDDADFEVIRSGRAQLGSMERLEVPGRGTCWFETARLPQFDPYGRVSGLVVVLHDVTDRKQLESQLVEARKLESIGKLAGGVAHDFNNLLTTFFGLIAAAQRELPSDSVAQEYLSLMQLAAEGGANFTKQLLAFARRQTIEPRVVELNALVRETSALLSRVLGPQISIHMSLDAAGVAVRVAPSQISQLLMNLALNARDAMAGKGHLTFRTASVRLVDPGRWALHPSPTGRHALLEVEDTGEGLSEAAKEHLFEPFFTSKAMGQGTGLGLATCYDIVKQNAGHIAVESRPGAGTKFSIYLPEVDPPELPSGPLHRAARPVRAGQETVLFAEDDDSVRYLSVAALASSGYRLIEAVHGQEALRAAAEHGGPIHLLVTDVIMPRMGGADLARRFLELRPDAGVLFISGAGDAWAELEPEADVLEKPFTSDVLLARVRAALDARPA